MNHTPGPWEHTGNGDIQGNEDNGHGMGPVDVCSVYLRTVKGRTEANARLVAAAPELLAALYDAMPYVEDVLSDPAQLACFKSGVVQRHAKAIRAAIAKAEGEQ